MLPRGGLAPEYLGREAFPTTRFEAWPVETLGLQEMADTLPE